MSQSVSLRLCEVTSDDPLKLSLKDALLSDKTGFFLNNVARELSSSSSMK
jgi:hypothetical protein